MNTNYLKDFVPYKQALELKKLGFDEPCFMAYIGKDKQLYSKCDDVLHLNAKDVLNPLKAPTFSQAFRWFREKYDLHSTITSISQESWQWHITKPGESLGKLYEEDFYTYEEAELAAIVKLIEIVKKQNFKG